MKPSLTTPAADASYLHALLYDLEAAEQLRHEQEAAESAPAAALGAGTPDWAGALAIGALAKGKVDSKADYALLLDLDAHPVSVGQNPSGGRWPLARLQRARWAARRIMRHFWTWMRTR